MKIQAQIAKGVYQKDIAHQLGMHPKTLSRAVRRRGSPSGKRPRARRSKLNAFEPLIDQLLHEQVWNAVVILREIQNRGYTGGITIVRDYIRPKRTLRESRATVHKALSSRGLVKKRPVKPEKNLAKPRFFERARPNQLWQSDILTVRLGLVYEVTEEEQTAINIRIAVI